MAKPDAAEKPAGKLTPREEKAQRESAEKAVKAGQRLQHIRKAREDLVAFTQLMMPSPEDPDDPSKSRYDAQKHHRVIAAALEAVERGEIIKLIITMPPRAGKSELAAKKFIPWLEGKDPYRQVIFASYNETFAEDTGRSVRDCMKSGLYNQVFPKCKLAKGSAASDRVATEEGGLSAFVGVGGTTTGRGADVLIIDDPVKDRAEADSPARRKFIWEWFTQVAMSRRMDFTSRVIIIMTRWHDDDLVGRLTDPKNECYNSEECREWKILELPALALDNDPLGREKGESIWPSRFSKEFYEGARRLDPRGFSALYQGRPAPEDGDFFKRSWIKKYQPEDLPKNLRIYAASDHAVAEKQQSDSTVMGCVGIDENNHIWVLPDLFWRKAPTDVVVEGILDIIRRNNPLMWYAEKGHISQAIGPFLRKRMMETETYCAIYEQTPVQDKRTRAQSINARMAMGMVHLPGFAPWYADAENELLKFPAARHDDFVDFLAWIGIGLTTQVKAESSQKKNDKEPIPGTIAWIKASAKREKSRKELSNTHGF